MFGAPDTWSTDGPSEADQAFIAAARTDVPRLLDELAGQVAAFRDLLTAHDAVLRANATGGWTIEEADQAEKAPLLGRAS